MSGGKRLATNAFVYVALGFLAPAVNFFLLPFYVRELSTTEFGIITLATLVQSVLGHSIGLGLSGAYNRFFFDAEKDPEALNRLFSTALIAQIISGLLVWGFGLLVGDSLVKLVFQNRTFTYQAYGTYITFTAIAMNLQVAIMAGYRNMGKAGSYAFWSILFFACVAVSIFTGVVILKQGAIGSVSGRMIGTCFPVISYLIFYFWNHPVKWSGTDLKNMLNYGLPLVPYLLLGLAFSNVDKWIIERRFSLELLGIYGFGFLIASIAEIFINAIQSAFYPSLFRSLNNRSNEKESILIENIFILVYWLVFIIIMSLIAWSGPVIKLFINEKYTSVLEYLPLLCLSFVPRLFFIIYGTGIWFNKKTKLLPFINAASFIAALVLGWVLTGFMGIYGIILAIFLSGIIQLSLTIYFSFKGGIQIPESFKLKQEWIISIVIILCIPALMYSIKDLYLLFGAFIFLWGGVIVLAILKLLKIYPHLGKKILYNFRFPGKV